jgi:hypothetical protein
MEDGKKVETTEAAQKTRRAFVKTAAQVAVTAPAVAALLSASTKPASATQFIVYSTGDNSILGRGPVGTDPYYNPTRGGSVYDDTTITTGDDASIGAL